MTVVQIKSEADNGQADMILLSLTVLYDVNNCMYSNKSSIITAGVHSQW